MPWTSPRTWTPRTKVTAAILNSELSGNLNQIASPPYCNLYATAATTMTTAGTTYAVAFDGEAADVGDLHSTTTNTSRITIGTAGLYEVHGGAGIAAQAAATRFAVIFLVDGSAVRQTYSAIYVPPNTPTAIAGHYGVRGSMYMRFTVGQFLELGVQCGTNGVATATASSAQSWLQARWLGP